MDKYTIEKFKPEHANYILSFGEVEKYTEEYDTKDLQTDDAWTGFYLGKPIACGGIHPVWDHVAEVWIIIQQGTNKHKFFLLKNIKDKLEETIKLRNYKRVQSTVRSDFKEGLRFAEWFGMESEGLMKQYGPDGKDYLRLARIE